MIVEPFKKILFIGVGLMSGSMIKDLQNKGLVLEAAVRRSEQFEELKGFVSRSYLLDSLEKSDWDLVVIGTPVAYIPDYVRKIFPFCEKKGVMITDVGSTKEWIAKELKDIPEFLGSHPMAGTEKGGFSQAKTGLFNGKTVVVCPSDVNDPSQIDSLSLFWKNLGAKIVIKNPAEHDRIVSYTSHFPHVISFLFTQLSKELNLNIDGISANSFQDFTRIAASDSAMWVPIFESNKKNLMFLIENFIKFLCEFKQLIEQNDWQAIENIILQSNKILQELKSKN